MMKKIQMNTTETMDETFERFIIATKAKGTGDKTLKTYREQYHSFKKYVGDFSGAVEDFTTENLAAAIGRMRDRELADRSIKSYTGVMKTFFGWCRENGINAISIKAYKAAETVKTTYTDEQLARLLKKPNIKKCTFAEYRNWVIVNFLMDNACRASTVRHVQNRDVDLENRMIQYRHNKTKKMQVIPLSEEMKYILLEYMRIRGGGPEDYLFPTDKGTQMKDAGLASAIERYNQHRGVENTSIHSFRHTFARKYLLDCGGDPLRLQKILGHTTLDMTKHYCAIFNADILKNYDTLSPLSQLNGQKKKIAMR